MDMDKLRAAYEAYVAHRADKHEREIPPEAIRPKKDDR